MDEAPWLRLERAMGALGIAGARPGPGAPPRFVAKSHPRIADIRCAVKDVARAADAARRAATREVVLAAGAPDIEATGMSLQDAAHLASGGILYATINERVEASVVALGAVRGMGLVAQGSFRAVYDVAPGQVLKVALDGDGAEQCAREARVWRAAPERSAALLCPVIAAGPGWVVMARAGPYAGEADDAFLSVTWDVKVENLGVVEGRVVVIDYGTHGSGG